MKTFKIYRHPTRGHEAVKVGFSWPAFFFGIIWMLVKRLRSLAAIWILAFVILAVIEIITDAAQSEPALQAVVYLLLVAANIALWLTPAFKGNSWRVRNLEKNGYELVGESQADTADAAIAQVARAV